MFRNVWYVSDKYVPANFLLDMERCLYMTKSKFSKKVMDNIYIFHVFGKKGKINKVGSLFYGNIIQGSSIIYQTDNKGFVIDMFDAKIWKDVYLRMLSNKPI